MVDFMYDFDPADYKIERVKFHEDKNPKLDEFKENPCYYHGLKRKIFKKRRDMQNNIAGVSAFIMSAITIFTLPIVIWALYDEYQANAEAKIERKNLRNELKKNPNNLFFCPNCKKDKLRYEKYFKRLDQHYPEYKAVFENQKFELKLKGKM